MKKTLFILRLAAALSLLPVPLFAESFAVPPPLSDEVRFWKTVFGTYDHSQVIVHDSRYLGVVYEVIDLSSERKKENRTARIREATERIVRSLERLALGPKPEPLSPEEQYIQRMFEEVPGPDKFLEAANRVRIQTGQRDHLMKAIAKSTAWIGDIEGIFEKQGLPRELTALVFIESMFNPQAVSEVGASGFWQFMPDTGQGYLSINAFWDDRNDPINSSAGAAQFLKDLHRQTGDWALAVNSYHSGPGRILKAVMQLKTKDISEIIARFDDPGYGFYSRNYYPEFLAVVEIYRHRDNYLGPLPEGPDLRYDIVQTKDFVNLPQVAGRFAINMDQLRKLNTALKTEVLSGSLPLPPNYLLRVPKGYGYYLANAIGYLPGS